MRLAQMLSPEPSVPSTLAGESHDVLLLDHLCASHTESKMASSSLTVTLPSILNKVCPTHTHVHTHT